MASRPIPPPKPLKVSPSPSYAPGLNGHPYSTVMPYPSPRQPPASYQPSAGYSYRDPTWGSNYGFNSAQQASGMSPGNAYPWMQSRSAHPTSLIGIQYVPQRPAAHALSNQSAGYFPGYFNDKARDNQIFDEQLDELPDVPRNTEIDGMVRLPRSRKKQDPHRQRAASEMKKRSSSKIRSQNPADPSPGSGYSHQPLQLPWGNKLTSKADISRFQIDALETLTLKLGKINSVKGCCFVNCLTVDGQRCVVRAYVPSSDRLIKEIGNKQDIQVLKFINVAVDKSRDKSKSDVDFDFRFHKLSRVEALKFVEKTAPVSLEAATKSDNTVEEPQKQQIIQQGFNPLGHSNRGQMQMTPVQRCLQLPEMGVHLPRSQSVTRHPGYRPPSLDGTNAQTSPASPGDAISHDGTSKWMDTALFSKPSTKCHQKNDKLTTKDEIESFQLSDVVTIALKFKSVHPNPGSCFINCLTGDDEKVVLKSFDAGVDSLAKLDEDPDIQAVKFIDVVAINVKNGANSDVAWDFKFVASSQFEVIQSRAVLTNFSELVSRTGQIVRVTGRILRTMPGNRHSTKLTVLDESGLALTVKVLNPSFLLLEALREGSKYTFEGRLRDKNGRLRLYVDFPEIVIQMC